MGFESSCSVEDILLEARLQLVEQFLFGDADSLLFWLFLFALARLGGHGADREAKVLVSSTAEALIDVVVERSLLARVERHIVLHLKEVECRLVLNGLRNRLIQDLRCKGSLLGNS